MKKYIYLLLIILFSILLGWFIPFDSPFDIKPEEVIEQYKQKHPVKPVAVIKKKELSEEEIEFLQEEYEMQYVLLAE